MSLEVLEVGWAALCDGNHANQLLAQHPRNHHMAQSNGKSCWVSRVIGNPRAEKQVVHCRAPCCPPPAAESLLSATGTHVPSALSFCFRTVPTAFSVSCLHYYVRKNTREVEDILFPTSLTSALALGLCEGMGMNVGWIRDSGIFPISGALKEHIIS